MRIGVALQRHKYQSVRLVSEIADAAMVQNVSAMLREVERGADTLHIELKCGEARLRGQDQQQWDCNDQVGAAGLWIPLQIDSQNRVCA